MQGTRRTRGNRRLRDGSVRQLSRSEIIKTSGHSLPFFPGEIVKRGIAYAHWGAVHEAVLASKCGERASRMRNFQRKTVSTLSERLAFRSIAGLLRLGKSATKKPP
jgi:hypothetical protein